MPHGIGSPGGSAPAVPAKDPSSFGSQRPGLCSIRYLGPNWFLVAKVVFGFNNLVHLLANRVAVIISQLTGSDQGSRQICRSSTVSSGSSPGSSVRRIATSCRIQHRVNRSRSIGVACYPLPDSGFLVSHSLPWRCEQRVVTMINLRKLRTSLPT